MTISLSKLEKYFAIDKLIYHSVDLSLYMVSAIIDGDEHYVSNNKGALLKSSKLLELQKMLRGTSAKETVLRHTSPYDEMIGGPEKGDSNALEVPLADNYLSWANLTTHGSSLSNAGAVEEIKYANTYKSHPY